MPVTTAQAKLRLQPVQRRKVSEEVASRLEALIRDGTLAAGDSLPAERTLMQTFGVGRPAVREALFSLKRMGLVELRNGERARVTLPTPKAMIAELSGSARLLLAQPSGMQHFQEARALFEVGLAEHAARARTEEGVAMLRAALAENEAALGDDERFERTDVAFHYALARMTGNPIFMALHDSVVEWLAMQRTVALRVSGTDRVALAGHRRVFEAVAAGDPLAAADAMRRHLREVTARYWQVGGAGAAQRKPRRAGTRAAASRRRRQA